MLARDLGVVWVLPSVALCGAYGYFSLLSAAFFSLALADGRPMPARLVIPLVGIPVVLLVVMVALGRLTTRAVAAWLAGRASLKRIPVWVLSVVATITAATAAAVVPTALFLALARR